MDVEQHVIATNAANSELGAKKLIWLAIMLTLNRAQGCSFSVHPSFSCQKHMPSGPEPKITL